MKKCEPQLPIHIRNILVYRFYFRKQPFFRNPRYIYVPLNRSTLPITNHEDPLKKMNNLAKSESLLVSRKEEMIAIGQLVLVLLIAPVMIAVSWYA